LIFDPPFPPPDNLLSLGDDDPTGPAVLNFLLSRDSRAAVRFYRVEVSYNLFGEYSVLREWGPKGKRGATLLVWFSNLRDACVAAERWRKRAQKRGYRAEGFLT
jgi:predicted DNA-binding WGR domain protein